MANYCFQISICELDSKRSKHFASYTRTLCRSDNKLSYNAPAGVSQSITEQQK